MRHRAIRQYQYHQWANNKFFEHLKKLPPEVYGQNIKSVFSSVAEVIEHIYRTDGMWLSVMSGNPFDETMKVIQTLKEEVRDKNLAGMQSLYKKMTKQYSRFF